MGKETASLREQFDLKSQDESSLRAQLNQITANSRDAQKSLEEKIKVLEISSNKTGVLQEKIDDLMRGKGENESALSDVRKELDVAESTLREKSQEISRLSEDNERLSDQLASAVERPSVEGQESEIGEFVQVECAKLQSAAVEEKLSDWENKYAALIQEKESMMKENKSVVFELRSELEKSETQCRALFDDLESQRAKNNELKKEKLESQEASEKALLNRLFPEVSLESQVDNHALWLQNFQRSLKSQQAAPESEIQGMKDENAHLEKQVAKYKSVLASTETMLKELEASVESEEKN